MNENILNAVDYDTLIEYLERYGEPGHDYRLDYPIVTTELIIDVMDTADECPYCLNRFLQSGLSHVEGCVLADIKGR